MSPRDDGHLDPELLALLALGETPGTPEETAEAQRHLARCGHCSSELDELSTVARRARQVTPSDRLVEPPASVWAGIAAELSPSTPGMPAPRRATGARRASWLSLAAAACVGLLVGGGAVYAATSSVRPAPAPSVVATASLAPLPGSTAQGRVEVVSTSSGPRVVVDVSGLAKSDGYYEVWLLDRAGDKLVALGALDGSARGSFAMPQGIAMTDYPVVDVSLQPPDGNPQHSHHSLVRGTLQT